MDAALQARIDEVRRRLPLAEVVEAAGVKLSGSAGAKNRRGRCPFHAGKSASFSVYGAPENSAHCFGCAWHGDVIAFVRDQFGLSFGDALQECEARAGISGGAVRGADQASPVWRERAPAAPRRRTRVLVDTLDMARAIWARARPDNAAVRRYFTGRGVPEWVMPDARLSQFRFLGLCPLLQWEIRAEGDHKAWPRDALVSPAIVAMVRKPLWLRPAAEGPDGTDVRPAGSMPPAGLAHDGSKGRLEFVPCGIHITFLDPAGTGTMVRRRPWAAKDDPDPLFPKRLMLGPVKGGAVLLGEWHAAAPLFVGEGNETVLSGMALADAGSEAVGVATLSLDNLQGQPRKWQGGIWPLFRIEPDPERPCFTIPGQTGPVTVLVDSDMAPLRRQKVVEAKGAPIADRAITGAERARICGELAVKGWRRAGATDVRAVRAPLGMDFNDAIQGVAA